MAGAKKCDRCGAFYDVNNLFVVPEGTHLSHNGRTVPILLSYVRLVGEEGSIIYDLCETCMGFLYYFLKNEKDPLSMTPFPSSRMYSREELEKLLNEYVRPADENK